MLSRRSSKTELVDGRRFPSFEHAEHETLHWISFYNEDRLHEELGDLPPAEYEQSNIRSKVQTPGERRSLRVTAGSLLGQAGRLLLVGIDTATALDRAVLEQLEGVSVGGILLLRRNVIDARQVAALVEALQSRLPYRPLVATDEEGGRVSAFANAFGSLPAARELAATQAPDQVREHARQVGRRLADLGVDWNLAPVADLDGGARDGPIGDRSFSPDAEQASLYAGAFMQGLQDATLLTCAKHFPGQGRASADTHEEAALVEVPREDLCASDVVPFRELIRRGVPAIMVSHATYRTIDPGAPATLSASAYRLLRSLGFRGVALTDSVRMKAIDPHPGAREAAVQAIIAGADMVVSSRLSDAEEIRDALIDAVGEGRLQQARLDEAAARVAFLKSTRHAERRDPRIVGASQ